MSSAIEAPHRALLSVKMTIPRNVKTAIAEVVIGVHRQMDA